MQLWRQEWTTYKDVMIVHCMSELKGPKFGPSNICCSPLFPSKSWSAFSLWHFWNTFCNRLGLYSAQGCLWARIFLDTPLLINSMANQDDNSTQDSFHPFPCISRQNNTFLGKVKERTLFSRLSSFKICYTSLNRVKVKGSLWMRYEAYITHLLHTLLAQFLL